jgi:hydrogenase nickel incorporation protein HypA/HybF
MAELLRLAQAALAGRQVATVTAVQLQLGELAGADAGALLFAFDVMRRGTPLAAATLRIEPVAAVVHCDECGAVGAPAAPPMLCCPACGGYRVRLVAGQELQLSQLVCVFVDEPGAQEQP